MSSGNGGYRRLGRSDLRGFNAPAIETILAAMAAGGTGRVSNKGHAILRAPNGGTMSVSRDPSKANRGLQNQESAFRRLFGMTPTEALNSKGVPEQASAPEPELHVSAQSVEPTLVCAANGCEATFVTEGARYSHVEKVHVKCRVPGCGFAAIDRRGESAHFRLHHEKKAAEYRQGKTKERAAEAARVNAAGGEDAKTLARIRDVLGPDPRVKDLQGRLDQAHEALSRARARIDELEAKIKLMKEALEL